MSRRRTPAGRILFVSLVAVIVVSPMALKIKVAVIGVVAICTMYAVLLHRLRKRRIGSAAVGSFYEMLEQDRRKAIEIIVEQKAEEQAPEDAEGNGPDA
jgi:Flp pilus assembly protein TadB